MSFLKKLFKDDNKRLLSKYEELVPQINAFSDDFEKLSDTDLAAKTECFRGQLKEGKTESDILPEVFATVREAARRTLGERHYDVQLIGGMVINDGNIAEMRTGEGKTLVATLPVYLNALSGKGVHVVTVNDYLARRDAVWMGQVYNFLGLSVGVINQNESYLYDPTHQEKDAERDESGSFHIVYDFLKPSTRTESYEADITYGTNNEFGFDYLRDNVEYEKTGLRQRSHHFAVIDEIDSVLIDEARTPLIISAPAADAENLYKVFAAIATKLNKEEDFTVDEKLKAVSLTDGGIEKSEKILGIDNIYTEKGIKYVHHLETAVRAKALFTRDKDYVVKDGAIVIVDEFTGRLQPSRRWSEGLHQAIEVKEGIDAGQESRTFASITYQNYFRMYEKLSGMTGTAKTNAEEFFKVYSLETVEVPTNKEIARVDHDDLIYQSQNGKDIALIRKIKEVHETGQPILVGTVSIEDNEKLSNLLTKEGIPHKVLNAKNHESEGETIADAGQKSAVTIATNMAGRGVDIKLGGIPFDQDKYEEVKKLGGLYVLGTERHEARRIDNQLRGRSGRQGDPGKTQFMVSMEDSLMRIFAPDIVKNMMGRLGIPEDEPIQNKIITRNLENAQTKIEGFNFDARKRILEFDNVLNTQRNSIYGRRRRILNEEKDALETEIAEIISRGGKEIEKTIEQRKDLLGGSWDSTIRRILLQTIDTFWMDHLDTMDYVRSSVNLRAYGQRDPLIEYKKEALRLFRDMEEGIYDQVIRILPGIGEGAFAAAESKMREDLKKAEMLSSKNQQNFIPQPAKGPGKKEEKYGRNDRVKIEKDGKEMEMKYKKAESYLSEGWKIK